MKKQLLFACMALVAGMTWANDSSYEVIGNQLVPLKETGIRITKEILTIELRENNTAFVDVQYEFTNPTKEAKTVLMGFEADPPYDGSYEPDNLVKDVRHPFIKDFKVEINGTKINYKNALSKVGNFRPLRPTKNWTSENGTFFDMKTGQEIADVAHVYYFNATFEPGVNKVHHTYSYGMGNSTTFIYFLDYKLTPAIRWANKQIDDFTLNISCKKTIKHFYIGAECLPGMKPAIASGKGKVRKTANEYQQEGYVWEVALRNGSVKFHTKNFRPKHELWLRSGFICDPLGTYNKGGYLCGLSGGDLTDLQIRAIRNIPYAARGHVFKDPELKEFFESCFWYMPDPNYKDDTSDFTASDWEYVNFKDEDDKE